MNSYDIYEEMLEMFGSVPDPRHQPEKFKFYLDSYLYLVDRDK